MHMVRTIALAMSLFSAACAAQAQTPPPMATITDAEWLAGRWLGEGLGGEMEEVWSPPVGGQMVGHFRLVRDGAPVFYEIMLLDIAEGGLRMRVKHFNPDFTGWEEKDEWVTFAPVAVSAEALEFSGLRIVRRGEDAMVMYLRLRHSDGVREEELTFRRAE
ncbi:MAG: DUF6265 family protein [Hyphomonadaceae bacterium]